MLNDELFMDDFFWHTQSKRYSNDNGRIIIGTCMREAKENVANEKGIQYAEVEPFYELESNIVCSYDFTNIINELYSLDYEKAYLIQLDENNNVVAEDSFTTNDKSKISVGFVSYIEKIKFKVTKKVIFIHSHPNNKNSTIFSVGDENNFIKLSLILKTVNIDVVDCLLTTDAKLYSFKKLIEKCKYTQYFPTKLDYKDLVLMNIMDANINAPILGLCETFKLEESNLSSEKMIKIVKAGLLGFDKTDEESKKEVINFLEDCLEKMKDD